MAKILGNFHLALLIGIVLLVAAMFGLHGDAMDKTATGSQFLRYLHVFAGILWIGLLYYFNFVQIPTMPKRAGRAEAGRHQIYRARGAVLVPLVGARDGDPRPARRRDDARAATSPARSALERRLSRRSASACGSA